jgi:hypothetical protein
MTTINRYELVMVVTTKATGERKTVTRLEHAYTVQDALMQALVNVQEGRTDKMDTAILSIGPPEEDILKTMDAVRMPGIPGIPGKIGV